MSKALCTFVSQNPGASSTSPCFTQTRLGIKTLVGALCLAHQWCDWHGLEVMGTLECNSELFVLPHTATFSLRPKLLITWIAMPR